MNLSIAIAFVIFTLATNILQADPVSITLEYARTNEERIWGLMGRKSLPENHGMLFVYPESKWHEIWAFNCQMDLSIAFIDDNYVITEIAFLKAYPEKMDPRRPVKKISDIYKYGYYDPIYKFFADKSIKSKHRCRYALEAEPKFFADNNIKVGDRLEINSRQNSVRIRR